MKYFEINHQGKLIYYKAPEFISRRYFRNYVVYNTKSPKIKFLADYYGADNINLLETDEKKLTKAYLPQVSVSEIRKGNVLSYNIASKEIEIVTDEKKKVFVNRLCLDGVFLYFTKYKFYNDPHVFEDIEIIKNNYIDLYLSKPSKLSIVKPELILDSENRPCIVAMLTNN